MYVAAKMAEKEAGGAATQAAEAAAPEQPAGQVGQVRRDMRLAVHNAQTEAWIAEKVAKPSTGASSGEPLDPRQGRRGCLIESYQKQINSFQITYLQKSWFEVRRRNRVTVQS